VSVPETHPVRGKKSVPNLGVFSRSCADDEIEWVSDYLHSNHYLPGARLQAALNRQRRRRQCPTTAERGGLSRREWRRRHSPSKTQAE